MVLGPTNLKAYNDESERPSVVYIIAGYVAPADEWARLESPWNEALEREGLREFKIGDCDGLPQRQRQFIELINSLQGTGYVTAVDLRSHEEASYAIKASRRQGFSKPMFLGFQQQVESVALHADNLRLPPDEQIQFVFDEQKEYEGNALRLFEAIKLRGNPATLGNWIRRLGSISFDDSRKHPGLQCADALAHEAQRYFAEIGFDPKPGERRWQWQELLRGGTVAVRGFGPNEIDKYVNALGWDSV